MRIIAGTRRGLRLDSPRGLSLRPTADRLKEALFNILAPRLAGCRFLDLYAGSGAIGLEALSRGASRTVAVEKEALSLLCLRANGKRYGAENELQIISLPAQKALSKLAQKKAVFDIVFLDPPYEKEELYWETLDALSSGELLAENALIVAEHAARQSLPEVHGRLRRSRCHRVGDSVLSFYGK